MQNPVAGGNAPAGRGVRERMRVVVLGGDGYCGWATSLYLSRRGHTVSIVDNFARRQWDHELGVQTLTPIRPLPDRLRAWTARTGLEIASFAGFNQFTEQFTV